MEGLDFRRAAEAVLGLAETANGFLNVQAPWTRMKQPGQEASVGEDLYAVLESCRWIGVLLTPLLPDLSQRVLAQLDCAPIPCEALWPAASDETAAQRAAALTRAAWDDARRWAVLPSPAPLPEATPVMQRLEVLDPL